MSKVYAGIKNLQKSNRNLKKIQKKNELIMHKNKLKTTGLILFCLVLSTILPIFVNRPIISAEKNENDEKFPAISAAPDIIYNVNYTIVQSTDDAWTNNAGTDYTSDDLELGGHNNAGDANQKRICLRWTLPIPHNARIIDAYINLTVKDTSTTPVYNGITANFQAFASSATPPFNDTNENIRLTRTKTAAVSSALASSYSQNETVQTDVSSLVQTTIDRGDWTNNSIFGVYIYPSGVTNTPVPGELIEFWSYDAGNSTFYPTLHVEWEESPYFIETPTDLTIQNDTLGYFFEWSVGDDNPDKYIFSDNDSAIIQQGDWQHGDEFRYDIPALPEGIYNYTIYINDTDGNYDEKHVIINSTYLNLPTISDIKFIQNGEVRDSLICGDGPFTMQINNNSAVNTIDFKMMGFSPKYNMTIVLAVIGPPTPYTLSPWSVNMISGSLGYNASEGDYFQGAPGQTDLYHWQLAVLFFVFNAYKLIQNIEYNVLNVIWIDVNSGSDFIYNNTVHSQGGTWAPLVMDIENIDISAPTYDPPTVTTPIDSSKNFEVQIDLTDEVYGSGVKEATLYYSVNGGASWGSMDMLLYEDQWVASIPPQPAGASILYKIEYKDLQGNTNTTLTYRIVALDYGDPSILLPGIITIIAFIGAIGAVAIVRNKARIEPKLKREESLEKKLKHLEQSSTEVGDKLHKLKNQEEEI